MKALQSADWRVLGTFQASYVRLTEPASSSGQQQIGSRPQLLVRFLWYAPANPCSAVPFRIIESLSILAGEAWGSSTARRMFA
jgi:hypothetical protein